MAAKEILELDIAFCHGCALNQAFNNVGWDNIEDILASDRKFKKALRLRDMTFMTLAEHSHDAIVRFDLEFHRTYINPAFAAIYGVPVKDMLLKTPSDFSMLPQCFGLEEKLRYVAQTSMEIDIETEYVSSSGKQGRWHIRFVPEFGLDDKIASILVIGRDMC